MQIHSNYVAVSVCMYVSRHKEPQRKAGACMCVPTSIHMYIMCAHMNCYFAHVLIAKHACVFLCIVIRL
jgi:hypothetical protein